MNEEMKKYIEMLKKHDWYYNYSDDHNAYMRGSKRSMEILELAKKVDPDYKIYDEYKPKNS